MFIRFVFVAPILSPSALWSATFTVINTNSAGTGSLRQAILDANANPGADDIAFDIATGGLTLSPGSALALFSIQLHFGSTERARDDVRDTAAVFSGT